MSSTANFPDMMVDLETTGLRPDRTAIIQIAAVKFNLAERTVDASSSGMFDRCLSMPNHRYWDEGTRAWWSEQKQETFQQIAQRAEDPLVVINDFFDFCTPVNFHRFWAKPSHFDYPFLASYFHDAKLPMPFHYRYATCMNSFLAGARPKFDTMSLPFEGAVHNALFDTLHQIKILFAAMDSDVLPNAVMLEG